MMVGLPIGTRGHESMSESSTFAGVIAPGTNRFGWDGRDQRGERVAPGVYFVRVSLDRTSRTVAVVAAN